MKTILLLIAVLCTLTATHAAANPGVRQPALFNTRWILKKIFRDDSVITISTQAFIRFDNEKNSAGGNGGCNTFGGTLLVKNDSLSLVHIFSTKMYCEGVQATETAFFRQLENVTRYKIRGKTLCLYNHDKLLLEFRAG